MNSGLRFRRMPLFARAQRRNKKRQKRGLPRAGFGVHTFVHEGGYTSVAVAVSLLVCLSLVFCLAAGEWTLARAADVQDVADAGALAAASAVCSFYTVAQAVDACVLSLGLTGMTVTAAGLVLAAIPGMQEMSAEALDAGRKILEGRNRFARSASTGLQSLEAALPGVAALNAARCVQANSTEHVDYAGAAVPFPLESRSRYPALEVEVSAGDVEGQAEALQEATQRAEAARREAEAALERAWRADCVDEPRCLWSRAASLAGLSDVQNPRAETSDAWGFGMAIERSRAYYARRLEIEAPAAADIESVTDSLAREAYYAYALDEVCSAWCLYGEDGTVDLYVPHLAHGTVEVRQTRLYTDPVWPCSDEKDGRTLHSTLSCPGAIGVPSGSDSVAAVESGAVRRCPICCMDVGDLGGVAAISYVATNGYEHYWQIVVDEAQRYQRASNEAVHAEREAQEAADAVEDVFAQVLDQLKTPRASVCPPGAWGCVGVVTRGKTTDGPTELADAFTRATSLPAGAAVSAAVAAPDAATLHNNVFAHLLDNFRSQAGYGSGGLMDSAFELWGCLLVGYGAAVGTQDAAGDYLEGIGGIWGGSVGAWLRSRLSDMLGSLGLQPADMRQRKPVLASAAEVLDKAGFPAAQKIRSLVAAVPARSSPAQTVCALGLWLYDESQNRRFTVAELPLPGTDTAIPFTVDLGLLGGAS